MVGWIVGVGIWHPKVRKGDFLRISNYTIAIIPQNQCETLDPCIWWGLCGGV